MTKRIASILLGWLVLLGLAGAAQAGTYTSGDVFVGIQGVGVNEYTPTGTLVQTINGGGLSGFVTGMAFQNNGDLLVTDFSTGNVVQYDNSGNLIGNFATGLQAPESIAIDKSGNVYVGQANVGAIVQYSSTGTFLSSTTAATQERGTDWIDLAADQKTMLYTSEGTSIKSVNVPGGPQNPDFANLTTNGEFALRIIPGGTFAGDVLVADSADTLLISADGSTVLKTYTLPGSGGQDFALNLDPNGTDFWTADDVSGRVWEVNIATGAIDNSWIGGPGSSVFGVAVFGQLTSSGGGGGTNPTPEPATLALLASGLIGLALAKRLANC